MAEVKQDVRQFYDQIGWSLVGEDLYQNARYEDLRPVSREYIHRCHLRVGRHLAPNGRFLLDAGSGPIQYVEYFDYSRSFQYRVCADISITALKEARKRLDVVASEAQQPLSQSELPRMNREHGLFVVADVANLPFKSEVFDGIVSLHTIHHLPEDEHQQAYEGLYRLLAPGKSAVVVNGWPSSKIMAFFDPLVRLNYRLRRLAKRLSGRKHPSEPPTSARGEGRPQKGTFTSRHDVIWIRNEVGSRMPIEILVWRSASVRFLRAVIYPWLAGKYWLRLLFWLEERNPHYFGENGQYPLIVIKK